MLLRNRRWSGENTTAKAGRGILLPGLRMPANPLRDIAVALEDWVGPTTEGYIVAMIAYHGRPIQIGDAREVSVNDNRFDRSATGDPGDGDRVGQDGSSVVTLRASAGGVGSFLLVFRGVRAGGGPEIAPVGG